MKFSEYVVAFYADDGGGTYKELVIDLYRCFYEFNYDTKEQFLCGKGGKVPEIKVSLNELYKIFDAVKIYNGGEGQSANISDEDYEKLQSAKPVIGSETLWRAIRRELPKKELSKILSYDYRYEKGDYYDYKIIMDGVRAVMADEIPVDYFASWLVLLMRCLFDNAFKDGKLKAEYDDLADWFDGFAFMGSNIDKEQKLIECREFIAVVKYANHKIENIKKGRERDFTTDGVITYVSFCMTLDNGKTSMDRVCVVDKRRRRINYMYVEEVDYREDINYTLLPMEDFDSLYNKYFEGYKLDLTMGADYASAKKYK